LKTAAGTFFYRHIGPNGPKAHTEISRSAAKPAHLEKPRLRKSIAGDRPPHYVTSGVFRLILTILNILQILLQTNKSAGDRPPRAVTSGVSRLILTIVKNPANPAPDK